MIFHWKCSLFWWKKKIRKKNNFPRLHRNLRSQWWLVTCAIFFSLFLCREFSKILKIQFAIAIVRNIVMRKNVTNWVSEGRKLQHSQNNKWNWFDSIWCVRKLKKLLIFTFFFCRMFFSQYHDSISVFRFTSNLNRWGGETYLFFFFLCE